MPFASAVLSAHPVAPPALMLYDATMLAIALLLASMWAYASAGGRLIDSAVWRAARRPNTGSPLRAAAVFALALALAPIAPTWSRWAWLLLLPAAALPGPRATGREEPVR